MSKSTSRRSFLQSVGLGTAALGLGGAARAQDKELQKIQGFEEAKVDPTSLREWKPVSDRKVRVGIVGFGACHFGAQFGFQDHPNVEVVAVSDLFPDRCAGLAKACRCEKTYPSLEELVKDDSIEAVFVATDPPSHAGHCIDVLKHGKHVACAVPAVYGSLEDADKLFEAVKTTGLRYMMYETSSYYPDLYAMYRIYEAGGFGKLIYSEGEYYHYDAHPIGSYKGWRIGSPPLWYPTHSMAYYVGVTNGSFAEVSCMGLPSLFKRGQPENNVYKNPFGTEIGLFRTSEGGTSRMIMGWDTPGYGGVGGRVRGQKGAFNGRSRHDEPQGHYEGQEQKLPDTRRPGLPPGVRPGGHRGSHGQLTEEFIRAILEDRQPWIDIAQSLNMTVAGVVAHQSAMKDGELMKIPQYKLS